MIEAIFSSAATLAGLFAGAAAVMMGLHYGATVAARWFGPININCSHTTIFRDLPGEGVADDQ